MITRRCYERVGARHRIQGAITRKYVTRWCGTGFFFYFIRINFLVEEKLPDLSW